jgi:hypothetical protein
MKRAPVEGLLACLLVLSGCATTQDAEKHMGAKYIGKSSDAFFSHNGPPLSYFDMNDGGRLYTWRGGETTIVVAAETKTIAATPGTQATTEKTTTTQSQPDPNTTVTKTTTTSFSVGSPAASTTVVTKPAQHVPIYCEVQITTDDKGIITDIKATGDTQSLGLVGSRCAEIFGTK